jgi:hypothetical protein
MKYRCFDINSQLQFKFSGHSVWCYSALANLTRSFTFFPLFRYIKSKVQDGVLSKVARLDKPSLIPGMARDIFLCCCNQTVRPTQSSIQLVLHILPVW